MRRRRSDNPDLTSDVSGLSGWRPARRVVVLTPEEQAKLAEAMAQAEGYTETEGVNEALRRFARSKRRQRLLALRGKVRWEGDVDTLRRERGFDLLDRLWQRNQLSDEEATDLAVQAQHQTRGRAPR